MARMARHPTDNKTLKSRPQGKGFTLHGDDGLFPLVKTSGKELWRFRYQWLNSNNRTNLSLGSYPALTLAIARQMCDHYLSLLAQVIDSQKQQEKASEQRQIELDSIFSVMAERWFQFESKRITEDYPKDIWRSLEKDVFPVIGEIPFPMLKVRTIVEAIEPIKSLGALETAYRLVLRINEIMIYSVNTGLINANSTTSGIGVVFDNPKKQKMPTLRSEELPKFMRTLSLSNLSISTRCLIEWQLLTLVRPSEASGTRWDEKYLKGKFWTIPTDRMKPKREHFFPLSPETLNIPEVIAPIIPHRKYVSPSNNTPKRSINNQKSNPNLKNIGYGGKLMGYGFCSMVNKALNEVEYDMDVIEAAVANTDLNEVRKAYTFYLVKRVGLMN